MGMENTSTIVQLADIRRRCASGLARRVRVKSGLSLREIAAATAERAGCTVSASTVYRWESGDARPTGDRALAYLAVLDELQPARGAVL